MFNRIRDRFGTAGLIVSVVALVAALAGTAFAAAGLNSKQKSQVKAIAKQFAGKPGATGPAGPAGPAGANGKDGAAGTNGTNGTPGTNGTNGTNGKSVTEDVTLNCPAGGVAYTLDGNTTDVCNGEDGEDGVDGVDSPFASSGGTLPPNTTETGAWVATDFVGAGVAFETVSFPVPLSAPLDAGNVHTFKDANFGDFDGAGAGTVGCTGSDANPTAPSGHFCLYGVDPPSRVDAIVVDKPNISGGGAGVSGARLLVAFNGLASVTGTFAVTG
ncbi:MAG TPA: hypothetical protein VNM89_07450 [Solirubrobacterales bacterium]|nr:hypothetical protein [Solirubrobacterales bacterium]